MRVRQPQFDFSNTRAHWAPIPEMAQMSNGSSIGIPALERFLNKVMARARAEIKGDDPASVKLRNDVAIFVKQESAHTAKHDAFNAIFPRNGYPKVPEIEKEIEAHYNRLLETKSLAFLTAYCEGFETLSAAAGQTWLSGDMDKYLEGADPNVATMWRWHVMEEYEHRHVCHDVYHRIHGGYFLRIYGFFYQLYHFSRLGAMGRQYLLSVDYARMTPEEIAASKARSKALGKEMLGKLLRNMWKVLSPFYRPHELEKPWQFEQVEASIDNEWSKKKAASPA